MQFAQINQKQNPAFKNGFYTATRELDSSVVLSRALVDGCGATIPWIIMANNNTERKEKARRLLFDYAIAYMSPFLTLPFTNRLSTRYVSKLTKSLWSNSHKAIHISNAYLKDTDSMMKELYKMSEKTTRGPLEVLFNKLNPSKKYEQKINVEELLKSCGGDKEKLRQKLIKAKSTVFVTDCLFTFGILGSVPFINNEITKKQSGQSGFSAEMSMADKDIVENRAQDYEKTKRKRYLTFLGIFGSITLAMLLMGFASIYPKSKSCGKFINIFRDRARYFDYTKGIYMSRLPFFLGYISDMIAVLLASRNKTERKDQAIRQGVGSAVFFGGDLLLGSLFTNISDRVFGTKLRRDTGSNKSVIDKIFPKVKPLRQVMEEVEQGKIPKINKQASAGIFWANMLILMVSLGFAIPTVINKMIKKDVEEDVHSRSQNLGLTNSPYNKPLKIEEFIEGKIQ